MTEGRIVAHCIGIVSYSAFKLQPAKTKSLQTVQIHSLLAIANNQIQKTKTKKKRGSWIGRGFGRGKKVADTKIN